MLAGSLQQAFEDYQLTYWLCKVCGLKYCKWDNSDDLLPFNTLKEQISNPNKTLPIKASYMKRMTNEPIHPKHARLTRRGVPIFRYSQLKVGYL